MFELIKYDLFSELLAKYADKLNFTNDDFSPLLLAQSYILNDLKVYPFLKALFKATIPKGEKIIEIVDAAKNIYDDFQSYAEKMKTDEKGIIDAYIKWCENRKGSVYEYDEITALITELIGRVKSSLNDKPVVLIIDDLDRLDPEHIFRLFNIFSAHYDIKNGLNKFDLDKVIFVCDYYNIENMYIHRYGNGVDFEGYINKFYSTKVFEFDNRKHLNEELVQFFTSRTENIPESLQKKYSAFNRENYLFQSIVSVFTILIDNNQLTIRNLDKFKSYDLPTKKITILDREIPSNYFFIITFFHLLLKAIDKNRIEAIFKFLEEQNIIFNNSVKFRSEYPQYYFLVNQSLLILIGNEFVFASESSTKAIIGVKEYEIFLNSDFATRFNIPSFVDTVTYDFNVFSLFKTVYSKCIQKNYL